MCQDENNGRKGWDSQAEVQTIIPWWEPLLSQQPEPLVLSPSSLSESGWEGTTVGFVTQTSPAILLTKAVSQFGVWREGQTPALLGLQGLDSLRPHDSIPPEGGRFIS